MVTREVDGGLQTITVKMPTIVTVDLRLNEPRYASLPNIMKAKAKPLAAKTPADYGVDVAPRLTRGEDGGTGGPQGGRQGRLGGRADCETQRRSGGDLMAVLLLADVNDGAAGDRCTWPRPWPRSKALGEVHVLVAGTGGDAAAAEAATLDGVAKVLFADDHAYCHGMAEPTAALIVSLAGGYSHICRRLRPRCRKNVLPRVAALAGRDGDVGRDRRDRCRHVRTPDLCRQRDPDGEIGRTRRRCSRCAPRPSPRSGKGGSAAGRDGLGPVRRRPVGLGRGQGRDLRPAGTDLRRASWCRAGAASGRRKTSP